MLWTKSSDHKMTKEFRIPHTVLYKLKFPTNWLFTSIKDGMFKRRTEINITKENILKVFLNKPNKGRRKNSDIVAQWIYDRNFKDG